MDNRTGNIGCMEVEPLPVFRSGVFASIHAAGIEYHDSDVVFSHFVHQCLGEALQTEFACRIGAGSCVPLPEMCE